MSCPLCPFSLPFFCDVVPYNHCAFLWWPTFLGWEGARERSRSFTHTCWWVLPYQIGRGYKFHARSQGNVKSLETYTKLRIKRKKRSKSINHMHSPLFLLRSGRFYNLAKGLFDKKLFLIGLSSFREGKEMLVRTPIFIYSSRELLLMGLS